MNAALHNTAVPSTSAVAAATTTASLSRARAQQRKRNADDAPYAGSAPATKRARANNVQDGSSSNAAAKRRRPSLSLYDGGLPSLSALSALYTGAEPSPDSMVDFSTLATPDLHEYLFRFDLVPAIFPSPLSVMDPPAPSMLFSPGGSALSDEEDEEDEQQQRMALPPSPTSSSRTPTPPTTPANRPRRALAGSASGHRRRDSRISDDGSVSSRRRRSRARTPILADVGDAHAVLAAIAQRHYKDQHVAETDALSSFMAKVKRGSRTRVVDAY